jgi:hypothetical protein
MIAAARPRGAAGWDVRQLEKAVAKYAAKSGKDTPGFVDGAVLIAEDVADSLRVPSSGDSLTGVPGS